MYIEIFFIICDYWLKILQDRECSIFAECTRLLDIPNCLWNTGIESTRRPPSVLGFWEIPNRPRDTGTESTRSPPSILGSRRTCTSLHRTRYRDRTYSISVESTRPSSLTAGHCTNQVTEINSAAYRIKYSRRHICRAPQNPRPITPQNPATQLCRAAVSHVIRSVTEAFRASTNRPRESVIGPLSIKHGTHAC